MFVISECHKIILFNLTPYLASIDVNFSVKLLKKCKIVNFDIFRYIDDHKCHFLIVFMVRYIDVCGFRMSQNNILEFYALFNVN